MKTFIKMLTGVGFVLLSLGANAGLVTFQLINWNSYDELDGQKNIILNLNLNPMTGMPDGSPVIIDGVGWELNIETIGNSFLSEASIAIGNSLFLSPGVGFDYPGNQLFSSNGIISLADLGIENITLAHGILQLQFFETFDDAILELDSIFSGNISFSTVMTQVPVPAAAWLLISALFSAGFIGRRKG